MFRAAPPHHTMGSIARWENNKPQQLFWQPQLGPFATSLVTTSAGQQLGYWGGLGALLLKTSLSEKNQVFQILFSLNFFLPDSLVLPFQICVWMLSIPDILPSVPMHNFWQNASVSWYKIHRYQAPNHSGVGGGESTVPGLSYDY